MRLIKLQEVMDRTGIRSTSIYNLIAENAFPKQVKLTAKSVAWVESEIEDWINQKVLQRDTTMS